MTGMTKKLLLVTIGTSLLEKEILEKNARFDHTSLDEVFFKAFSCDKYKNNTYPSNNGDNISVFVKTASLLNITNELKKREKDYKDYKYDPDRFPAEISSVLLYLQSEKYFQYDNRTITITKNNNIEYDIRFLISDTPRCKFCAKAIQYYFNNKIKLSDKLFIPDGNLHIIDKLSENSAEFNNGLQKLLTTINETATNADAYQEIVFNITAGYKGVVPYMVLAGMCYKNSRIIYLYETSKSIIEIPRLPVNFDLAGWNDNRAFLRILNGSTGIYKTLDALPIPEDFRNLFTIDDSNNKVSYTPFGNFLKGKYESTKQEKALSEFGRGYILADLIQDTDKQKKLKKWINNSQNIWYGDNIPEAVDHSRGHCQRLLELAAQIIKPINAVKDTPFLNDDELIVLNLVLWFHDIGHSGREMFKGFNDDTVQGLLNGKTNDFEYVDISDFPTANRDLHHILGFIETLKDENAMEFYGFKDNGEKGYLPVGYLKAAIYAYLYHRKKMLEIKNENNHFVYSPLNVEIKKPVPEEYTINVNGQEITIPLKFIAALQAFVDECDNSRERTGDEEYNKRREWQTDREIKTEYDKLQFVYKNLTCKAPFELILKIFRDENDNFIDYKSLLKLRKEITLKQTLENRKTIEEFLNCLIKQSVDFNKLEFKEMSKTLNKLIFKLTQKGHFDKSDDIKSVFIQPAEGFSNSNYKFNIWMESGKQELFQNNKFPDHQSVKDIKEQYGLIKDILQTKKIVFNNIYLFDENERNGLTIPL